MANVGFDITFRMTEAFFDRPAVQQAVDMTARRALSLIGRDIRQRARRSIKVVAPTKGQLSRLQSGDRRKRARALKAIRERRGRVSAPGQPPLSHSPAASKESIRNILYVYDRARKSVVVGPVKLNQVNRSSTSGGSVPVPQLLEEGGVAMIEERSFDGGKTWYRRDQRRRVDPQSRYRRRRAIYKPRPCMGPALEKEVPEFPGVFDKAA